MKRYPFTRRYRIWAYWSLAGVAGAMLTAMFDPPEWIPYACFIAGSLASIIHMTVDWLRFEDDR
jgi:hypothetical protein